ncbi:hypothetical protein GMOD_00009289 [Pyrenophora seminiperda CCB06]|uniref:Uncharacterized protein n=1 Tax=Pyrenophora seminiperda CCB06 TaxID=1302712 RepID=A0A3M7MC05_9PLEO|nr:hypothetical protein GMOD_00009289 [Pyrenophora seminiperda CCB06]
MPSIHSLTLRKRASPVASSESSPTANLAAVIFSASVLGVVALTFFVLWMVNTGIPRFQRALDARKVRKNVVTDREAVFSSAPLPRLQPKQDIELCEISPMTLEDSSHKVATASRDSFDLSYDNPRDSHATIGTTISYGIAVPMTITSQNVSRR